MAEIDDLDRLIGAIKREALLRGDAKPFHERTYDLLELRQKHAAANAGAATGALVIHHIRTWMPLHGEGFLRSAYWTLLGREADESGLSHFGAQITEGRLSRWEVAGRLRLSKEGREQRAQVKRLWIAFVLARIYRLPIIGPVAALTASMLRFPAYLCDNRTRELLISQLLANRNLLP